jgi:HTH-type transcriptional regulator / antitoxin HigA
MQRRSCSFLRCHVILIDSDAEFARARALVDQLRDSGDPTDVARLQAQVRPNAAYEDSQWPRRTPNPAELIRHLMDQHGLTRVDMVPILGGASSRVSEVLRGKKRLSVAMVQRLRTRFQIPADLLLPPLRKASASPSDQESRGVDPRFSAKRFRDAAAENA